MSPTAKRIPSVIAFAGFTILAAFTWVEKGPSRSLQWPWYLYAQILPILPAAWLVAQGIIARRLLRFGGLLDFGLIGFAAAMTAAALASPERPTCLGLLPIFLAPVTMAFAVLNWVEAPDREERSQRLSLIFAGGLAIASLLALFFWIVSVVVPNHADGWTWSIALSRRNETLLGHAVYNAGLGVLTLAWLGGLARDQQGIRRILLLAGAALGLAVVLSSGSRSGFIGIGIWLVWLLHGETRRRRWSLARTATLGLLTLAAAGIVFAFLPRSRLIFRQWQESRTLNSGDVGRLAMAEFGGLIFAEHPILGIGAGATPLVYPQYRAKLIGGWETALQLHSTPVQWAAETGLAGLFAASAIAIALLRRRRNKPASFAAGALLAYAGVALTDYQLDLPVFAFAVGTLVGLLGLPTQATANESAAASAPPGQPPSARPILATVALVALIIAYAISQIQPLRARGAFAAGMEALRDDDPAGFEAAMAEAHRLDPSNIYFLNLHACILADIGAYPTWFRPLDLGPDSLQRAIALFRRSLATVPLQEFPHTHLAWHLLKSTPDEAADHFRAAARLIPDKAGLYYGLGLAFLAQQRTEEAARALAMEMVNNPAFVSSPEWIRLESVPGLAARARSLAAAQLEQIAARGDATTPAAHLRRARYAAALLRWLGGDDNALPAAAAQAEPAQREMLEWLSGKPVPKLNEEIRRWHALAREAAAPGSAPVEPLPRGRRPTPINPEIAAALKVPDRRQLIVLTSASPRIAHPSVYRERPGYNLVMRNVDAPVPRDPSVVTENRIVRDYFSALFPEKGFLPGPELIQSATDLGLLRPPAP